MPHPTDEPRSSREPLGRFLSLSDLQRSDFLHLVIFEVAYFLAYKYGMALSSNSGSPFWFPDSVLLCALLLSRRGMWWAYILAPLPLRLLVTPGLPMEFLLLVFANDSLKGLAAAYLVRRSLRGREIRFHILHDLWLYVMAAVLLAPALSGLVGAAAWLALGREFWPVWRQWFLGDAIANLVCTPLLIYLVQDWRKLAAAKPARYAEATILFLALPLAAYVAHKQGVGNAGLIDPFGYIPLPFLIWAAVRFGPAGASGALSIMSILSVAAASANRLRLPEQGLMDSTLSIQLFMVVLAIPILSLSVLVEQQRRTEDSLRESDERFRNMADTAPVLIWVSGPDKFRTFVNKVWLEFTGRTIEQALRCGWAEGVHPDDIDRYVTTYTVSYDSQRPFQLEYRLRRRDGKYRWVLDSGVPRLDPGNVFLGYIGSCLDITDLKRSHDEDLKKQKLETVGTLASGIAHDFNNLLGVVLAHSELALAELAEGSNPGEELQRIHGAATRGAEIVRQLMVYAGEETRVPELVDVSPVVEDMLGLLRVSVSKHATVETDLSKHLPAVKASAAQVRQIVMNLLYNASEALDDHDGVIRVTTCLVTVTPNSSLATAERLAVGQYVKVEVSDTGRGMTPEVQARIFEPFFTTKAVGGHGLGLSAVHGIVQHLHGAIRLSSELGKGSTFQILLPCEEQINEATDGEIARAEDETLVSQAATILVVDDEDILRQAVSKMLRKRGLSVLEAGDGSAALDVIRARKGDIDVLLLDITLPGASSREVHEEAKRLVPNLSAIITSAKSEEMAAASLGTQVERFLRKPFRLTDLVEMIREALSSQARTKRVATD